jgi:AraC-like DNA-binding protein
VNTTELKAEIELSLGALITDLKEGTIRRSAEIGNFLCSVQTFDHLCIIRRDFETGGDRLNIPIACTEPCVQMIFSLDGQSTFNDRFDPFILSPASHCINFFNQYECTNLLDQRARQHDLSIRLDKGFYMNLITDHLASVEDRLPAMIMQQHEFNTINQHLPADAAISGILKNILECPFTGEMKDAFIREHVRALFLLQLFHFSPIVTSQKIRLDTKINKRDEDILQDIRKYIDAHFLDPASLETLSKHFGINEFKLKHGFKLLFNTSPMRYLQYKRLEYSRFLLRDTDQTIKSIADEIGYGHAANFTTAFTKAFGHSPQYYRVGRKALLN